MTANAGDSPTSDPATSDTDRTVTGDDHTEDVVAELVSHQVLAARSGADLDVLSALEAKIAQAVESSRSPATLRAYRSDWADFTLWCDTHGLDNMPAAPATIAAYLADLAEPSDDRKGLAASTIKRRKAAIGEAHKLAGHPNPCLDPLVKVVSTGVRRRIGVAPKHRKQGVTTADIQAIITGLDGDRLIDIRDKAILLLGFATGMRRSELVALDVDDIERHPEGLIVHKRKSKTDQEAAGERIEVAYGQHHTTCPVRAYRTWIDASLITHGPILRPINRHGTMTDRRLSGEAIALIIKKHVIGLGYDPNDFAGHSFRRGFSTTASRNGASDRTIARTTGHTSAKGLQPYIEDAELFTDPGSKYLGL